LSSSQGDSAQGDSDGTQPSRRTVLGWAAATVGLAAGVQVAGAPVAAAAPAGPEAQEVAESVAAHVRDVLGKSARKNAVALTIDDGPDPTWTPKVLELLAANRVRATFSLVGEQARAYPKLVRRIAAAGHGLCNHSMTHPQPFGALSQSAIRRQVVDAQAAISDAVGEQPELFRSPGGNWTPAVIEVTEELGLTPVGWSVDPRDWSLPGAAAIQASLRTAVPGDILLCHDGGGNRAQTVVALEAVLPQLRAEGLRFVVL
jgi:peptidoglycan-N-acetylglucosamine deacetylase